MLRSSSVHAFASVASFIVFLGFALALAGCQDDPISSSSEESPTASATHGNSTASVAERCDVVVPTDETDIQTGVDAAGDGETVCVEPGTYEETVEIATENVTLRGRTRPNGLNPVVVDGHFSVEPAGAGATIRRFRITSSGTFEDAPFPHPFGVRVTGNDVHIENNVIEGFRADFEKSFSIHGVHVFGLGSGVSNVTIRDNVIRNFEGEGGLGGIAAVKIQADVDGATVTDNRITDHHSTGWVWGVVLTTSESADGVPQNVTVEENHIDALNDGSVYDVFDGPDRGRRSTPFPGSAFGIDGDANAKGASLLRNDLLAPNGVESKDENHVLDAECNWWGARSGPTADDNPNGDGTWVLEHRNVEVQFSPWQIARSPSRACIGGKIPGLGAPGPKPGPHGRPGR